MSQPTYLNTVQVALKLGVSRQRVQQLRASGALPASRLGESIWMFKVSDVEAFSEKHPRRKRRPPAGQKE